MATGLPQHAVHQVHLYDMIWYDMMWYDMIWYDSDLGAVANIARSESMCVHTYVSYFSENIQFLQPVFDPMCTHSTK